MKELFVLFLLFVISTIVEVVVYSWLLKPSEKTRSVIIIVGLNVLKFALPLAFQIITYHDMSLIYDSISFDLAEITIFNTVNDICIDFSMLALLDIVVLYYLYPSSKNNKLSIFIVMQLITIVATICVNYMMGG